MIDGNRAANDDGIYELSQETVKNWFDDGRYCRIGTIGDGSCFFHSVCKALDVKGYRSMDSKGRRGMIQSFRSGLSEAFDETQYEKVCTDLVGTKKRTYDQMKTALGHVPTWADEAMIRYVADKLKCNIVFMNFGNNQNRMYCGVHQAETLNAVANCGLPQSPTVIVAWIDHSHFELIGRIDSVEESGLSIRCVFDPSDSKDALTISNVMRAYQVKCKLK